MMSVHHNSYSKMDVKYKVHKLRNFSNFLRIFHQIVFFSLTVTIFLETPEAGEEEGRWREGWMEGEGWWLHKGLISLRRPVYFGFIYTVKFRLRARIFNSLT